MIRNFKVLGLALVAMLAMTAVVASAASASKFMSEGNVNTNITASQVSGEDHVFTVDGSSINCSTATFATTSPAASPSETITVHPTYGECDAFGFLGATVTTTGCDYNVTSGAETSTNNFAAKIKVVCSGSNKIVITSGTCEATVAGGTEVNSGVSAINMPAASPKQTVTIKASSAGVATTKTKDGFLCPFSGTGSTTGSYSGNTEAKGTTEGGSAVGITVEP